MNQAQGPRSTSASSSDTQTQGTRARQSINNGQDQKHAPSAKYDDVELQSNMGEHFSQGPSKNAYKIPQVEVKAVDDTEQVSGKPWRAGAWARFPRLSFVCFLVILTAMAGLVAVLLVSDGKPIDSWSSGNVRIRKRERRWKFSVSAWYVWWQRTIWPSGRACLIVTRYSTSTGWSADVPPPEDGLTKLPRISLFSFIMSQALSVIFAQAIATSFWVDALKGQTLNRLHHKWAVRESVLNVFRRWRLWGWVCVASLAFTTFAGLEAMLQTASSSTTALSSHSLNTTARLANALPAGFSGVIAATGHDSFGTVYYTNAFNKILQDYAAQPAISLDVDHCPTTVGSSCNVTLPGVGFQYTCEAGRRNATFATVNNGTIGPPITVFSIAVEPQDWALTLNISWKDTPGDGMVIATRQCTLTPALVEYQANVSQNIVALKPATSTVNWTTNSTGTDRTLVADKVLQLLPELEYDRNQSANVFRAPGTHSTTGGLGLAFNSLFKSNISIGFDPTNQGADTSIEGSFVASYAQFEHGTGDDINQNTFASPMNQIMSNIRDIMFRSSVLIAQSNLSDYELNTDGTYYDHVGTNVPVEDFTRTGNAQVLEAVYKTNRLILAVAISLMLLALLAILPLYWGFWLLGRDVSMSPIEIAKALHCSAIVDSEKDEVGAYSVLDISGQPDRLPQYGSNFSDHELVKLLGERKVRYGEVRPHVLGIGLKEYTNAAGTTQFYH